MKIKVCTVQMESLKDDKASNISKMENFILKAAGEGCSLILFPEMCINGYWHLTKKSEEELFKASEPAPGGSSFEQIAALAKNHGICIGFGFLENDNGKLYNAYVLAEPDGSWHRHRKIHAFESKYISPGDSFTVFESSLGCRIGILICYDNNIIENVRITALMGADIILAPHQTGGCDSKSPHAMKLIDPAIWFNREKDPDTLLNECQGDKGRGWIMRWLPSRAHDNGVFYVFSNGIGYDEGEIRTGNAMILDPYGRTIAESKAITDDAITGELDFDLLVNCSGRRWMRGRKPWLYGKICETTGKEFDPVRARFSDERT